MKKLLFLKTKCIIIFKTMSIKKIPGLKIVPLKGRLFAIIRVTNKKIEYCEIFEDPTKLLSWIDMELKYEKEA